MKLLTKLRNLNLNEFKLCIFEILHFNFNSNKLLKITKQSVLNNILTKQR